MFDKEIYAQLREGGIDDLLARHLAHLFIRYPLAIYVVHAPPFNFSFMAIIDCALICYKWHSQ